MQLLMDLEEVFTIRGTRRQQLRLLTSYIPGVLQFLTFFLMKKLFSTLLSGLLCSPAPNPLPKEAAPAVHNISQNEAATAASIPPTQAVSAAPILSSNPASSSNLAPRQQVGLAAVPAVYAAGCPPQVAAVHATAEFKNCPSAQLEQGDLESLQRFLLSENHLKENILKVNWKELSSRSFRNNMFTHTLSVELHVATSRLSESPVNYIRRNLEKSEWKRSNGTLIGLSRICS